MACFCEVRLKQRREASGAVWLRVVERSCMGGVDVGGEGVAFTLVVKELLLERVLTVVVVQERLTVGRNGSLCLFWRAGAGSGSVRRKRMVVWGE